MLPHLTVINFLYYKKDRQFFFNTDVWLLKSPNLVKVTRTFETHIVCLLVKGRQMNGETNLSNYPTNFLR